MSSSPEPDQPDPGANAMTDRFRASGERILDALLEESPEWASELGDHRFADRLVDHSPDGEVRRVATLTDALGALDEIDDTLIPPDDRVDLETLRSRVSADLWRTGELRPHTWDPLLHVPGDALYPLIHKDTLPPDERLRALAARCRSVPAFLATARDVLDSGPGMPQVHVETAIARTRGVADMLGADVDALLESEPTLESEVVAARDTARDALEAQAAWLESRAPAATADPRLGAASFAAELWYALDAEISPDSLLTRAESDLIAVEEEIAEVAAEYDGRPRHAGQVRDVLDRIADRTATTPETVRPLCEDALAHLHDRVAETGMVSVPDHAVRLVEMPPARRGVSVAYCDPPGPLAPTSAGPTLVAVAPPPEDWPQPRRASFHREYNEVMLRNLMVHEALPGHALQLAHAAREPRRLRRALWSGTFVEGWAVYAERALSTRGWVDGAHTDNLALRLVRLKMELRAVINAILDVRVHAHAMTEAEAMELMVQRGHQEEGEAAGKWRRAQLTSAQLSTYYVGDREVTALARDLAEARPDATQRELHDTLLAHGSPSPRHLRTLLGLGGA